MAKIAKFSKYSEKLKKHVEADVFYHLDKGRRSGSSTGFFFIVIPDEFKELYETYQYAEKFYNRGGSKIIIRADSADDTITRYVEYLNMYTEAKSVTEKVIMYRYKFSSKNKTSAKRGKGYMSMDGVENTFEAKIEFDFVVCEKTNFHGKITYKALDEQKISNRSSRDSFHTPKKETGEGYASWVELPYHKEAEVFFGQIYVGMENIMDKLKQYLHTDELVLESIKNHQKLLA
jgi:hypothetical protein